jgi:hypothetical protein
MQTNQHEKYKNGVALERALHALRTRYDFFLSVGMALRPLLVLPPRCDEEAPRSSMPAFSVHSPLSSR